MAGKAIAGKSSEKKTKRGLSEASGASISIHSLFLFHLSYYHLSMEVIHRNLRKRSLAVPAYVSKRKHRRPNYISPTRGFRTRSEKILPLNGNSNKVTEVIRVVEYFVSIHASMYAVPFAVAGWRFVTALHTPQTSRFTAGRLTCHSPDAPGATSS